MPFLSKDEIQAEANKLGVDLTGLTWPQQQKAVAEAKALQERKNFSLPPNPEPVPVNQTEEEFLQSIQGNVYLITPEIAPTIIQNYKYDEDIGLDMEVEEAYYELGKISKQRNDSNFKIVKNGDTRLMAQSSLPKIGSAIYYDPTPGRDLVPITRFQGKEGYIWAHPSLPSIKNLLRKCHYYERMKDRFIPNRVWYSANKILACDINTANEVFSEIEELEALKRVNGR